ncbi:hypothetical protein L3X38_035718 [Prunus dulcis]|uniref:Uncharacterized protein n=1 Tax=Prunus dulcis TaxID=3755 RepID=A0AAD4VLR0_PRUDU|nr:hypothetical protein L3X38_035718 [Prunus dulcis]
MTGASSSSSPSRLPPPVAVVSPKNGEEAAGAFRSSPQSISLLRPPNPTREVSRGVSYPALRQAPYVALVVRRMGRYCDSMVSRGVSYPALRQAPYVALVIPAYGEIL